jgi:nitric oxide reductase NorQ protein
MVGLAQQCECANPKFRPISVGEIPAKAVLFCEVCSLPKNKHPVLLEGDAGCGKNHLIEWVAFKLGLPLIRVQLDATTEPQQLIGDYYMNAEGRWVWVDGPLTIAVRYGGIFDADEINMARGDITAMFHSVLEQGGKLVIPQRREFITPHKRFWFVATCNPDYSGTRPMNEALRDRFTLVPLSYNERIDKQLTGDQALVDVAKSLREMYKRQELPQPVGTRSLIEFVEMRHRFGARVASELFIAKFPVENRPAVKDAIAAMVTGVEDKDDKDDEDDD